MRQQSSAIARVAIAIKRFWDETTYAQEKLLERPWDHEGPLRWKRDLGGSRLIGSDSPIIPEALDEQPIRRRARRTRNAAFAKKDHV
jgi:hypothetical protein